MAVCEMLKQATEAAKQSLMDFGNDLRTSLPVTADAVEHQSSNKLRQWGFQRINEYRTWGCDLDQKYIRLMAQVMSPLRPSSRQSQSQVTQLGPKRAEIIQA